MRSLEKQKDDFARRGVQVVAISVDPPATSKELAESQGYTFPILSDESGRVLRQWDLLHEDGHGGHDISRPAEFLVASDRKILWRNLTASYAVRPDADDVLEAIDAAMDTTRE